MQLKREAKLLTMIGEQLNMQTVALIHIISSAFVTYYKFSELIRKISPTYNIFFSIYRPSHHKILVPIGPVAKSTDIFLENPVCIRLVCNSTIVVCM